MTGREGKMQKTSKDGGRKINVFGCLKENGKKEERRKEKVYERKEERKKEGGKTD